MWAQRYVFFDFNHCLKRTKIIPKRTFPGICLDFTFFNSIFAANMYTLSAFLLAIHGLSQDEIPSEELYCLESNTEQTFLTNQMRETLAGYSYTLVREGWLELIYNDHRLMLQRNDLLIYSPGFQITIIGGSTDYHSVCLMVDEQLALETPGVSKVIRTAYQPIAELGQPVIHLSDAQAAHFWQRLQEIIMYQGSNHRYLKDSLRTLFTQFVLDLMDVMETNIGHNQMSERSTELFVSFMQLLTRHFVEHHDILFYAEALNITTTHLSRIVRQMTGRTVIDYINQMLFMEAAWLLNSTDLTIASIAEQLHFSDQSSFSRFFARMKGVSPKVYRIER